MFGLCSCTVAIQNCVTHYLQVLCAVLEFDILESSDLKMQIITTLQSTSVGKKMYATLCERQIQLRELVCCYQIEQAVCLPFLPSSLLWEYHHKCIFVLVKVWMAQDCREPPRNSYGPLFSLSLSLSLSLPLSLSTPCLLVCCVFAATERWPKEADPALKVHRCRPGQDAEFGLIWQPGMSQPGIHTGHVRLCSWAHQAAFAALSQPLVHTGE